MYWWYILLGSALLMTIMYVVHALIDTFTKYWDELFLILGMCFTAVVVILLTVCLSCSISAPKEIRQFNMFKEYVESINETGSYADVALTTKKIDLNSWLMDAKASKLTYGNWSFYSEEVLEIEPIR